MSVYNVFISCDTSAVDVICARQQPERLDDIHSDRIEPDLELFWRYGPGERAHCHLYSEISFLGYVFAGLSVNSSGLRFVPTGGGDWPSGCPSLGD